MTPDTPTTLDEALALIARQQTAMAALQADQDAWLRMVAHDLRSPLRHVLSFAPLLREAVDELAAAAPQAGDAATDAREFATTMEHSARKMADMLEGLAQLSRAARSSLQPERVDAVAVAQPIAQALQLQYPQVQWQWPAQPVWVWADVLALRAVWQALLHNAAKFSHGQANPQVVLTAEASEQGWQLVLRDPGVGFDRSRATALFQPFQRMHRDGEFAGVGCGLALVQTLAQRHGAAVAIDAQPGAGCTVTLQWPSGPEAAA